MTEEFWNSKEISSRYTSVKPLGSGGMGTVCLAKDTVLDKLVAIKVLDANLTSQQSIRFQREGRLSGKLNHENIVSVLDFGVSDKNIPYLVMEYLPGTNLGAMLKESGPLELEEAVPIFMQICAGMIHSHANGILHRDLKPENIIVSDSNHDEEQLVKIVDFGIARLTENDAQLTQSGGIVGSPLYMAPEQSTGDADERSDIYSLGCLMFATLTGQPPFVAETPLETLMLHKSEEPPTLTKNSDRSFPEQAEEIIAKCLRKNPEERYESFRALQADLTQLELSLRPGLFEEKHENDDTDNHPQQKLPSKLLTTLLWVGVPVVAILILFISVDRKDLPPPLEKNSKPVQTINLKIKELELATPEQDGLIDDAATATRVKPFSDSMKNGYREVQSNLTSVCDADLAKFSDGPQIRQLTLKRTMVTGVGFKNWKTYVSSLFLDGNPITYEGLQHIRGVPALQSLSVRDVNLTPDCIGLLGTGSNLSSLYYSSEKDAKNPLKEDSLSRLSPSKTLAILEVGNMQISEKGIESILSIKKLSSVKFNNCTLTDAAFQRLSKPNNLQNVSFMETKFNKDQITKICKLSVPSIGFYKVKMEPEVLMSLEGNQKVCYLEATSPGIKETDIKKLQKSLPQNIVFGVDPQTFDGVLEETIKANDLRL